MTKNPAAVELGRRGGLKGGAARAAALTAEQRKAIAVNAAKARWKKVTTPLEDELAGAPARPKRRTKISTPTG
jgi:hypothetical protein